MVISVALIGMSFVSAAPDIGVNYGNSGGLIISEPGVHHHPVDPLVPVGPFNPFLPDRPIIIPDDLYPDLQ